MSSPPENMKLEGLVEDNWDEGAATPEILSILNPYREQIEDIAARFDPSEQSWRDYRSAVWSPVPEDVMDRVRVAWVKLLDSPKCYQSNRVAGHAESTTPWVRREDEPDIDSTDGVDLLVTDRYEMADLTHAGLVITGHEKTDRGLIAHVRFPPRCCRSRYIVGRGIGVVLPRGVVTIEGTGNPWKLGLVQATPAGLSSMPPSIRQQLSQMMNGSSRGKHHLQGFLGARLPTPRHPGQEGQGMKTVFPNHFPAHESLQEFAARVGKSPRDAHKQWSNRSYPEILSSGSSVGRRISHPARGPGLALRLSDIAP